MQGISNSMIITICSRGIRKRLAVAEITYYSGLQVEWAGGETNSSDHTHSTWWHRLRFVEAWCCFR